MLVLKKCITDKFLDALSDQQWIYLHDNHIVVWPIIHYSIDNKQGADLPFFPLFNIRSL